MKRAFVATSSPSTAALPSHLLLWGQGGREGGRREGGREGPLAGESELGCVAMKLVR